MARTRAGLLVVRRCGGRVRICPDLRLRRPQKKTCLYSYEQLRNLHEIEFAQIVFADAVRASVILDDRGALNLDMDQLR